MPNCIGHSNFDEECALTFLDVLQCWPVFTRDKVVAKCLATMRERLLKLADRPVFATDIGDMNVAFYSDEQ